MVVTFIWLISLLLVGYGGYALGQSAKIEENEATPKVLNAMVSQPASTPSVVPSLTPQPVDAIACAKSGYAQKWEYLTSYTVKEKDSVQAIAEAELGDSGRANEIIQINGLPLVSGSTIYLPPAIVKKSNGYLKQVNGKLIEKNASMWHLSFNEDEKGLGILIPSYWFTKIPQKDSYQVGDCLTILLDDGNTVFSVASQ